MGRAKMFTTGLALSLLIGITSPVPAKAIPPASVWSAVETRASFSSVFYDVNHERFVATDREGLLYASYSGLDNWEIFSEISNNAKAITYCGGKYVTVSSLVNPWDQPFTYVELDGNSRATSYDQASGLLQDWQSVTCASNGSEMLVAVANTGTGNRVATSADGINWISRSSASDKNWKSVAFGIGTGITVAVASESTTDSVMISEGSSETQGVIWETRTAAAALNWTSVTHGKGLFVAVASNGADKQVMTSPDGGTWTLRSTPSTQNWTSVTYGDNGYFVAVASSGGPSNNVMISPDGINWTTQPSVGNQAWSSVAYGNGRAVAVSSGNEAESIMATSLNAFDCDPDQVGNSGTYKVDGFGVAFDGSCIGGILVIDESVKSVGKRAFDDNSLTSVLIPEGVTSIDERAFEYNPLTAITIPSSVTHIYRSAFDGDPSSLSSIIFAQNSQLVFIGSYAFSGAEDLESIEIPRSVASIDEGAFRYATNLTSVTFEDDSQLVSIGRSAFGNAQNLESIEIPKSVTSIGRGAFENAYALQAVTFEANSQLQSIGYRAFRYSRSLISIEIPSSVITIGDGAFEADNFAEDSSDLITLSFRPNSQLETIGDAAFAGANSLVSITIPSSVTSIGADAFRGATALKNVFFSENSQLETISESVFSGASSLENVTIPSTVTSIGYAAFSDASALTNVFFRENSQLQMIGELAFANTSSLFSIDLPNSLVSIGDSAFQLTALTSITFPSSLTSIGNYAFREATSLSSFYFMGSEPGTTDNSFAEVPPSAVAFVNAGATGFVTSGSPALWKGLTIQRGTFTPPLPLYRNWQTSLAEITNGGPKAGETVYASAFERALPRTLYKNENNYRADVANYPTPEEYVYRITKQPNSRTSSVDHQSSSSYDSLDSDAQAAWYGELGFTAESPYQFTWKAFVCVNQEETAITKPTGLSLSYASREDGLLAAGGFNAAHNLLFKNAAINWHQTINPGQSSRSAVGYLPPDFIDTYTRSFLGELDPAWHSLIWGFLDLNGSCAAGTSLKALTILDSSNSPITTKSFAIPEQLNLDLAGNNIQFSSIQVTIGVTGGSSRRDFNAALWGLTTIAETSEPPPAPPAPPAPPIRREPAPTPTPEPAPTPAPTPAPAATTNLQPSTEMLKVGTVYMSTNSYFLNNATKNSLRKLAREIRASNKNVVLVYGYTDNRGGVNNTWLSRQRAKAVANYIRPMLKGKRIVIGWYASGKPVSTGTSAADLALNRRVEIYTK